MLGVNPTELREPLEVFEQGSERSTARHHCRATEPKTAGENRARKTSEDREDSRHYLANGRSMGRDEGIVSDACAIRIITATTILTGAKLVTADDNLMTSALVPTVW